jgi:hypothetical protein
MLRKGLLLGLKSKSYIININIHPRAVGNASHSKLNERYSLRRRSTTETRMSPTIHARGGLLIVQS